MKKTIAIFSGGDWNDASCEHLVIDENKNLDEIHREYLKWYPEEYLVAFRKGLNPRYLTFTQWLVEHHGASKEHSVEEYHE